jgi:hypothetical protein
MNPDHNGRRNGDGPELLSAKELAGKLKRNVGYVRAMTRGGFRMVAGRTTLEAAMVWLAENGRPYSPRRGEGGGRSGPV